MTRAVEIARRILQVIRAAITVGERDAVNLAGERRESGFIRMRLAGESERHHGAAVESVFEGDDRGTLGIGAGDLDGVLYRFGSAVDEESFLGKLSRRDFVHALGEADVAFVGRDLDAGVEVFIELAADGLDDGLLAMTSVGAADASGEVDVAVAIDIFEPCVFGFRHVDWRAVRKAAGHGLRAARGESF